MTTEGEQQEAVCGTCGYPEAGHLPWTRHHEGPYASPECVEVGCHLFDPAPVVPSDDERCECGLTHEGDCPECGARWMAHRTHAPKGKDFRSKVCPHSSHGFTPSTPPTPSQDAEGDGVVAARKLMRDWFADCGISYVEQDGFWGVGDALAQYESAIRAPYEELVKAAREPHVLFLCSQAECTEYGTWSAFDGEDTDYQCQRHATARPEWWIDDYGEWQTGYEPDEDVIRFVSILAHIEESLGGRKDA